jgi:hypothetical protein
MISTVGNLRHDLLLLLYDCQFALGNQFDRNSSGRIRPLIVEAKTLVARDILRGDWCAQFSIPGFDLRYYLIAPSRGLIWSIQQSLLIPVKLLLLLTAWFRSRLGKLKASISHSIPQAAIDGQPAHELESVRSALEGKSDVAGGAERWRSQVPKSRKASTIVGADIWARDDAGAWKGWTSNQTFQLLLGMRRHGAFSVRISSPTETTR